MSGHQFDRPGNPCYGDGLYRRRIRLSHQDAHVLGELEDDCHGFRVRVGHDGDKVTAVTGDTPRIPMNTCAGAISPLQALVGIPLDTPAPDIVARVNPRSNCTHLYDLSLLAMAHASQDKAVREYDVEVHDRPRGGGPARAEVALDGVAMHRWMLDWTDIVEPAAWHGRPVLNGFSAWANEAFEGLEREAAFVLSKGVFVAFSRIYDMSASAGQSALEHESMLGACYSYSEGVVEHAVRRHDSVRDFSTTPEQLLEFRQGSSE